MIKPVRKLIVLLFVFLFNVLLVIASSLILINIATSETATLQTIILTLLGTLIIFTVALSFTGWLCIDAYKTYLDHTLERYRTIQGLSKRKS